MTKAKEKPRKKDIVVEQFVLLTDKVHLWIVRVQYLVLMRTLTELMKGLFVGCYLNIYLENSSNDNWKQRKHHVVESNGPTEPK